MRPHPPHAAGCLSPQGDWHLQTSQLLTVLPAACVSPRAGTDACPASAAPPPYRSDKQVPMRAHPPLPRRVPVPWGTGTANPLASFRALRRCFHRMPQAWQTQGRSDVRTRSRRCGLGVAGLAVPCTFRRLAHARRQFFQGARESSSIRSEPPSTALNRTPSTNNNAGRGGRASCGKIAVNLFDGAVVVVT